MKKTVIGLLALVFLVYPMLPVHAQSEELYQRGSQTDDIGGEVIVADAVVVRPVGIAAIVFGACMAIVATPFALASGSTGKVYQKLVAEPFNFTFTRPLGEF